ncbi:MAG TPA: FecR domain-containing protein [Puia sp.]|jgi:ferric-dicitrate binding protein FerR (iron transport regulator)|nr:FecR domain-containing protein [Puia sp.]
MNRSYITGLLVKHLLGTLTAEEDRILKQWLASDERHPLFMEFLLDKERLQGRWRRQQETFDKRDSWEAICAGVPGLRDLEYPAAEVVPAIPRRSPLRIWAALLIALLGLGIPAVVLLWPASKPAAVKRQPVATKSLPATALPAATAQATPATVTPATATPPTATPAPSGFTLQYADSPVIDLKAIRQGWQLQQGNAGFSKPAEGVLRLSIRDTSASIGRVVLVTPRHGNYRLLLPDSSIVDLNADTRIEVDSAYGRERRVALEGEAYFQVRHRDNRHFSVKVRQQLTIVATGTAFDVKAYPEDSAIHTQLLSGRLEVRKPGTDPKTLGPGQSLTVGQDGGIRTRTLRDMTDPIPWIHDEFAYKATPIKEILHDLSRWYNVEMVYRQEPTGLYKVAGSRQDSLPDILHQLETTGHLRFEISGKKVVVSVH